jgi:hypothetical protein
MLVPVLVLLLVVVLFGAGSVLHVLWWAAAIALGLWLVGFLVRPGGGRWYRW